MSNIPSRSRSLRKPAAELGSEQRNGAIAASNDSFPAPKAEKQSQSPSRLPLSRGATNASRPPSGTGSTIGNGSMRPPPTRANIGTKTATGGLQRSTSNRRSNVPAAETDPVKRDRSRPPITTSRHLRNPSASSISVTKEPNHARTRSASTYSNSSSILRPPTRGSTEESKSQSGIAESYIRKPAFSTLQQHFSPAKSLAPKPHPAAFLAPPSPSKLPSNIAISAETTKLQTELLQLHLLHKDSSRLANEWRASAKRKLGARFQAVVSQNDQLVQLEVAETGRINATALKKWQDLGVPGWGLEERIQILDDVVTGVWNLGEPGGRYAKLVRKFDRWVRRCEQIMEARAHDDDLEDNEVAFLEELDSGWRDDCLILSRKLETWRDNLKDLGKPDCGSSLGAVVNGMNRLVEGMLTELEIMARVERDAMSMELEWIKGMNEDVTDDEQTHVAGAVWRFR